VTGAMALQAFDVVVVPFPFTDRNTTKRRPALVLSSSSFNEKTAHSVMAMITSAEQANWPGDHPINDLITAGLPAECKVRLKLFTLDHRLVIRKAGELGQADQKKLQLAWKGLLLFSGSA
jgi:mRNA interferase MazF